LKRRRPLISGAPTRVTIASVDEPPTKRQSIADENAEILAATDVHTTLEMPAKSSIPEANIQIITACQEVVEACIVPQALPPGITVRRRKSRLAPKQVPSISKKTSSPAALGAFISASSAHRGGANRQESPHRIPGRCACPCTTPVPSPHTNDSHSGCSAIAANATTAWGVRKAGFRCTLRCCTAPRPRGPLQTEHQLLPPRVRAPHPSNELPHKF